MIPPMNYYEITQVKVYCCVLEFWTFSFHTLTKRMFVSKPVEFVMNDLHDSWGRNTDRHVPRCILHTVDSVLNNWTLHIDRRRLIVEMVHFPATTAILTVATSKQLILCLVVQLSHCDSNQRLINNKRASKSIRLTLMEMIFRIEVVWLFWPT